MKTEKTCRRCNMTYPLTTEYFYSNGYTPSGTKKWKPTCKQCENVERKESFDKILLEVYPILECQLCGYSRCIEALEFHHKDSSEKDFNISQARTSRRNRSVVLSELKKCILVCANCHREIHYGIREI